MFYKLILRLNRFKEKDQRSKGDDAISSSHQLVCRGIQRIISCQSRHGISAEIGRLCSGFVHPPAPVSRSFEHIQASSSFHEHSLGSIRAARLPTDDIERKHQISTTPLQPCSQHPSLPSSTSTPSTPSHLLHNPLPLTPPHPPLTPLTSLPSHALHSLPPFPSTHSSLPTAVLA